MANRSLQLLSGRAALVILIALSLGCASAPGAAIPVDVSLPAEALEAINQAVLEVVVPKPEKDSLQYERPLPMDLIPYAIRTDKYYSIGTAFAISPQHFVTAAHVMFIGTGSLFDDICLRDASGKIYRVDKIVKYSRNRDFVVFTVKNRPGQVALPLNLAPRVNQKVFAVGNALAQGIVIRDGLYTSNTPEEEAGEWQWARFSAAASPGNSGGPLLDKDGKVIGIVLRKSENENLNYALPLSEVMNAPENRAVVHVKMTYRLDNMDMTKVGTFHKEIPLPKTYEQLDTETTRSITVFAQGLLDQLLAEHRKNIFPNGKGSVTLLNNSYNAVFPHVIAKNEDGNWDVFMPKEPSNADLGDNGFLSYGKVGVTYYFYIHKPDNISMKRFTTDSKLFMDLLLKGVSVTREIGSEKIKIVSMGKAASEKPFTDSYGRIWTARTWRQEYNDQTFAIFSLPVPGGAIAMLRVDDTGSIETGHLPDLRMLTDFIYLSYYGTFKEWKEFLALNGQLPSIFSTLKIEIENDKLFRFTSRRFSATYGPDLMNVNDNSDLNLRFTYFQDKGKVVWDLDGIVIGDAKHNKVSYTVFRYAKPPKELSDKFQSAWQDVVERKFPFNRSVYSKDDYTAIATVYGGAAKKKSAPSLFYTVGHMASGTVDQAQMDAKLDGFLKNLKVYEIEGQDQDIQADRRK